jgi:hypothetical protein
MFFDIGNSLTITLSTDVVAAGLFVVKHSSIIKQYNMNLKKALKEKNNLKGKINETFDRIRTYNITEIEADRPYDPQQLLLDVNGYIDQIVDLKTRIQLANNDVYQKIYRLSELKNFAAKIKYLPCRPDRYDSSTVKYNKPVITTNERDALVEEIQKQIEQIQEELDEYNYRTKI